MTSKDYLSYVEILCLPKAEKIEVSEGTFIAQVNIQKLKGSECNHDFSHRGSSEVPCILCGLYPDPDQRKKCRYCSIEGHIACLGHVIPHVIKTYHADTSQSGTADSSAQSLVRLLVDLAQGLNTQTQPTQVITPRTVSAQAPVNNPVIRKKDSSFFSSPVQDLPQSSRQAQIDSTRSPINWDFLEDPFPVANPQDLDSSPPKWFLDYKKEASVSERNLQTRLGALEAAQRASEAAQKASEEKLINMISDSHRTLLEKIEASSQTLKESMAALEAKFEQHLSVVKQQTERDLFAFGRRFDSVLTGRIDRQLKAHSEKMESAVETQITQVFSQCLDMCNQRFEVLAQELESRIDPRLAALTPQLEAHLDQRLEAHSKEQAQALDQALRDIPIPKAQIQNPPEVFDFWTSLDGSSEQNAQNEIVLAAHNQQVPRRESFGNPTKQAKLQAQLLKKSMDSSIHCNRPIDLVSPRIRGRVALKHPLKKGEFLYLTLTVLVDTGATGCSIDSACLPESFATPLTKPVYTMGFGGHTSAFTHRVNTDAYIQFPDQCSASGWGIAYALPPEQIWITPMRPKGAEEDFILGLRMICGNHGGMNFTSNHVTFYQQATTTAMLPKSDDFLVRISSSIDSPEFLPIQDSNTGKIYFPSTYGKTSELLQKRGGIPSGKTRFDQTQVEKPEVKPQAQQAHKPESIPSLIQAGLDDWTNGLYKDTGCTCVIPGSCKKNKSCRHMTSSEEDESFLEIESEHPALDYYLTKFADNFANGIEPVRNNSASPYKPLKMFAHDGQARIQSTIARLKSKSVISDQITDFKHIVNPTICSMVIKDQNYQLKGKNIPMNLEKTKDSAEHVNDLLKNEIIRVSNSKHSSAAFIVNKRSEVVRGKSRMVIDYRRLNANCEADAYTLPNQAVLINRIQHAKIYSKFDCKSAFWQVKMDENSIPWTAFTTPQGLFEHLRMPFGFKNSPSIWQRKMDQALKGLEHCAVWYVDDILVFSPNMKEHILHLQQFFDKIEKAHIVISEKKMQLYTPEVEYLGSIIGEGKIRLQPHIAKRILEEFDCNKINDKKTLQSFLGLVNYAKPYLKDVGKIISPLYERCGIMSWIPFSKEDKDIVLRVQGLAKALPDLSLPLETDYLILETDGSSAGWGAVLKAKPNKWSPLHAERICGYGSGSFRERGHLTTMECEMLSVQYGIERFKLFLVGQAEITIRTDCEAIVSFHQKLAEKKSTTQRWVVFAQAVHLFGPAIKFEHVRGKENSFPDYLSRREKEKHSSELEKVLSSSGLLRYRREKEKGRAERPPQLHQKPP